MGGAGRRGEDSPRGPTAHLARVGTGLTPVLAVGPCMTDHETSWLGLPRRARPLVLAGAVLGVGLGGFFDGIVFHQLLQWHHVASARTDPSMLGGLQYNVALDGVFHALTYTLTVLGVVLLLRAWRRPEVPASGRTLLGSVVLGWGLFNLLEGLLDHHLLGLHHVWPEGPGPVLLWDLAFLAWGLAFVLVGYGVVRGAEALGGSRSAASGVASGRQRAQRDDDRA